MGGNLHVHYVLAHLAEMLELTRRKERSLMKQQVRSASNATRKQPSTFTTTYWVTMHRYPNTVRLLTRPHIVDFLKAVRYRVVGGYC